MENLTNLLISNPKKLFLLDGVGALLSAFFLVVVLPKLEEMIGLPLNVLYTLSILPFIYSLYSISSSFFAFRNWRLLLRCIAMANLFYCCVTIAVMILFFQQLTFIGLIYFLMEIIIIIFLVWMELKATSFESTVDGAK